MLRPVRGTKGSALVAWSRRLRESKAVVSRARARRAYAQPSPIWRSTKRRATAVLVLIALVALLTVYAVTTRSTTTSEVSGQVLLDARFDDGELDPAIWNTCHWWADQGCTIASNDEQEWYVPEQVSVA